MSTPPAYLPIDLATQLPLLLVEIGVGDSDSHWKVARLAEKAFADGYRAGYSRAISDRSLREVAEEQRCVKAAKELAQTNQTETAEVTA